jgi:hypothetical protein
MGHKVTQNKTLKLRPLPLPPPPYFLLEISLIKISQRSRRAVAACLIPGILASCWKGVGGEGQTMSVHGAIPRVLARTGYPVI